MLSKKITFSLLSLIIATPFAHASKDKPEPVTIVKKCDGSAMILGGLPMHQPTRWENFVYKVAPLDRYIPKISGYAGAATAALALGLSLKEGASFGQTAVITATAGVAGSFATFTGLGLTYFCITESLD